MNIIEKIQNNFASFLLMLFIISIGNLIVVGQVIGFGKVKKNSIGMELVEIPAGTFMMGSPETEAERDADEGPQRKVTIGYSFLMGKYEVTQKQWETLMDTKPSNFRDCPECPVENVSWDDAKEFIAKLNAKNDGYVYRLPSEAEWEYAARAGTKTAFAFGDTLSFEQANFDSRHPYGGAETGKYHVKTLAVGSYKANAFGLYDMHGSVWEWVEDIYEIERRDGKIQPRGYRDLPTDGSAHTSSGDENKRVRRGGSWKSWGKALRSANRTWKNARDRNLDGGFRIVATPK